jgi:PAS domain S-box-containing protein
MSAALKNIIETKQTAQTESERLLKEISASIPGLVYQFKTDASGANSFTYVSEGAKSLLGIEPREVYENVNAGFELVHPDDLAPLLESIKTSANTLEQWLFTFRIIKSEGTQQKWIRANSSPHKTDDGSVIWNGTMIDVTDAKEAENELLLIRRVVENSVEGIAICDVTKPGNPITYVNKSFEKLFGYKASDVIGKSRVILMGEKTNFNSIQALRQAVEERKPFSSDMLLYKSDGTTFWDNITLTPIPDSTGVVTHFVSFHNDITNRKNAEAEIKALNESLEQKVAERTSQLTQANKELETFNYTVSHDLQSPLRLINGYAKLLNKKHGDRLDDEGKGFLKAIDESAVQMSILVNELLAFAKLGKAKLEFQHVETKDVVQMVLEEIKLTNNDFKAEVSISELKPVIGDFWLLKQLWFNLIDNAVKYSSKKEFPIIELGMKHTSKATMFYVKDNGAGFNMNEAGKLFDVFNRMSNANDFKGTGIGLATVHRIVTKHGGKIWAEAEVNNGATFYFSIPDR